MFKHLFNMGKDTMGACVALILQLGLHGLLTSTILYQSIAVLAPRIDTTILYQLLLALTHRSFFLIAKTADYSKRKLGPRLLVSAWKKVGHTCFFERNNRCCTLCIHVRR